MKKVLLIAVVFLGLGFVQPVFAADPHFSLSPTTGDKSGTFDIQVKIDTGGKAAGGADVYLNYQKDKMKIETFTKGTAFPEAYSLIKNDEGRLRVFAYFPIQQAGDFFNGADGLVGTIKFSALSTGQATTSFICTAGQTNDSNIVDKTTSADIIVCASNVGGTYNLTSGGGGGTTPTPTPTTTSAPTVTATPTTPVSGILDGTFGLLGLGIIAILTGLVLIL